MNHSDLPEPITALAPYQPRPNVLYSLDYAASFTGVPRRDIVLYARYGLISPVGRPDLAGWYFTAESIHQLRRIQQLRTLHSFQYSGLRLVFDLIAEITRLRAQLNARDWRSL